MGRYSYIFEIVIIKFSIVDKFMGFTTELAMNSVKFSSFCWLLSFVFLLNICLVLLLFWGFSGKYFSTNVCYYYARGLAFFRMICYGIFFGIKISSQNDYEDYWAYGLLFEGIFYSCLVMLQQYDTFLYFGMIAEALIQVLENLHYLKELRLIIILLSIYGMCSSHKNFGYGRIILSLGLMLPAINSIPINIYH